jgi:EAL domain-containing protein (putative c-di-GMP-specific phosphodiesterase class I)
MDAIQATPDWLNHLKLINFDILRERVGPRWPRIEPKIELLAARLIEDEMSEGDRYLNLGEGRFLVFFAKAYREEMRIRCLAIARGIEERLFGLDQQLAGEGRKLVHVHAPDMGAAARLEAAVAKPGSKAGLWDLFHEKPHACDPAEIDGLAQLTMDTLIAEAGTGPAGPLRARLAHLARNLAVVSRAQEAEGGRQEADGAAEKGPDGLGTAKSAHAMRQTLEDIAALCDAAAEGTSAPDLLEALARLRKGRVDKMLLGEDEEILPPSPAARPAQEASGLFEYHPVFHAAGKSAGLHQGIFRIARRDGWLRETNEDDTSAMDLALVSEALRDCAMKESGHAIVMVPVHADTLRRPAWQRRYSLLVRGAGDKIHQRLVTEVMDYHGSENSIALRRAIEELKANSLGVFVALPHEYLGHLQEVALHCREIGVHALGVDFSHLASELAAARAFAYIDAVCKRAGLASYVRGLAKPESLARARAAGLDYVCAPGPDVCLAA